MTPVRCAVFDVVVALPAVDVTVQSACLYERIRAELIGRDATLPPLRVWVTGATGRLRGLSGLHAVVTRPENRTAQPHQVKLEESPDWDGDVRPIATCVVCGAVGRYAGPPDGHREAWSATGLLLTRYTVRDPDLVRTADDTITWEDG